MRTYDRLVFKYTRLFRSAMKKQSIPDADGKAQRYSLRLQEMYASDQYRKHNIYPTMNVALIYAVIAMCLELRGTGLSNKAIMAFMDTAFHGKRKFFDALIRLVNCLPNSFLIAKKWNISDHAKRVVDHSITYDTFVVSDDAVEYRISKCMYVEMFDAYGIRELCKIFCETDTRSYAGLTRHVTFIRHSDLSSDGGCCWDEVRRR